MENPIKLMYSLTQVPFLRRTCFHYFKNNLTEEIIKEECSQEDYDRMGEVDGSRYNPVKEGYTWIKSVGGALMVDTKNGELGDNEYCIVGDEAFAKVYNPFMDRFTSVNVPTEEIINSELEIIWQ